MGRVGAYACRCKQRHWSLSETTRRRADAKRVLKVSLCMGVRHADAKRVLKVSLCKGVRHADAKRVLKVSLCMGVRHADAKRVLKVSLCMGVRHADAKRVLKVSLCMGVRHAEPLLCGTSCSFPGVLPRGLSCVAPCILTRLSKTITETKCDH